MDKLIAAFQADPFLYGGILAFIVLLRVAWWMRSWLVLILGGLLIGGAVLFGTSGGPESLDSVRQEATDQVKDSLQRARDVADTQDRRLKEQLGE